MIDETLTYPINSYTPLILFMKDEDSIKLRSSTIFKYKKVLRVFYIFKKYIEFSNSNLNLSNGK